MICNENGVMPGSEYFFFAPTATYKKYYPCIINCGHFYCKSGYQIKREGNHPPLFVYVIDGSFYMNYENGYYKAQKGDIVLIDGNKPHRYHSGATCEFIYIHYVGGNSLAITEHLLAQNENCPLFQLANREEIFQTANAVIQKLLSNQEVNDMELSTTIFHCLCSMQAFNTPISGSEIAHSPTIEETIRFIRDHVIENLSLHDIAAHVNMSTYYLSHLFKQEVGCSPIEYEAQCKINLAKTMLDTTEQTIASIADYLGYSSSASFINAFKRRCHVSPARYRSRQNPSA